MQTQLATPNGHEEAVVASEQGRRPLETSVVDMELLRRELKALRSELATRDATIRDLQAQLQKWPARANRAARVAAQRQIAALEHAVENQTQRIDALVAQVDLASLHHDELQSSIDLLQTTLAVQGLASGQDIAYRQLIRRIREVVGRAVPPDATIIVLSKGDNELLNLGRRQAWHFPQAIDGAYTGYYPASSTAAIVQLEVLRAKGGDYLLLPATALWWLEHYGELKQHLEHRYRAIVRQNDTCMIFALREPAVMGGTNVWMELEELIADYEARFDRSPAILNWNTGLDLAAGFPQHGVFSPPVTGDGLPYLDHSIDIVVVSSADSHAVAEAHRVAQTAVVTLDRNQTDLELGHTLTVDWKLDTATAVLPTVSIIIPCSNGTAYTEACLTSLRETLPRNFRGEIIVVDDGSTDETAARLRRWSNIDKRIKVLRNRNNSGFLASATRGARAATGDILVFLNNDTILLPGWLPPLLRTFRDYPDAGSVGGKLVFPDGTLQEAGGIVFCDGSAAHFGRGDHDIDATLYNFVRDVDYCSAALLATRRSLFIELGGFDTRFQPGYYEDTDYCFTIRNNGYRVYYQPESTIIHLEGASAGTNAERGMKRYQALNRGKFMAKWREALKRQPSRPSRFDAATWHALAARDQLQGVDKR
jgi:GT2 family glycosyltransferase